MTAYIAVMAIVTYLVRAVPFTMFRKKIKSPFVRRFLGYVPYGVLSAMTFPAMVTSTGNTAAGAAGTAAAVILAFFELPLIVVALAASAVSFAVGIIIPA